MTGDIETWRRRVASWFVWSDFLDEEVARRMQSRDEGVRRRATWVAEAAIAAGKA